MPEFSRIVSAVEAHIIRTTGRVPTNYSECGPYDAGEVVFLFTADSESNPDFKRMCDRLAQDANHQPIESFVLLFNTDLVVEPDQSGWDAFGAVVHRGEIDLANAPYSLLSYW